MKKRMSPETHDAYCEALQSALCAIMQDAMQIAGLEGTIEFHFRLTTPEHGQRLADMEGAMTLHGSVQMRGIELLATAFPLDCVPDAEAQMREKP